MDKLLFRKKDYVSYDPITNKSTCLLCEQQFAGCIVGNIKRHYEALHHMNFHKRRRTTGRSPPHNKNKKSITKLETTMEAQETSSMDKPQQSVTANGRGLKLKREEFIKCCVGLVGVTNVSPAVFDDEKYFKKLLAPYEEEYQLNLNSNAMMEHIETWSTKVVGQMKTRLWQKRINLKLDLIKRQQRNLMLINAGTMENYRMYYLTLGVVQVESWHNDQILKDDIFNCLQDYDIDWRQLYSVVGDSCGQLTNVVKALEQEIEEEMSSEENNDGLRTPMAKPFILNCGNRWLQLAVQGYLDTVESSLADCRKILTHLKMQYDLQIYNVFTPTLDNPMYWESTLSMVCCLKEFVANHNELDLKIEWMFVEQFIAALTPVLELSQHLQSEQYLVGDFYRDWLLCEAKLKKIEQNEHAAKILENMLNIKQAMIANEAFNAALYFDPRFNFLDSPYFSEEKRKETVQNILKLANKTQPSLIVPVKVADATPCCEAETNPSFSSDDPYNILELELHSLLRKNASTAEDDLSFRQKLEKLALNQRQPYAVNVLSYWRNQGLADRNIVDALNITLALTIGQITAGKANRALANTKTIVSDNCLRDVLIINLNESVMDVIKAT